MFLNKWNQIKISNRNLKNYKYNYTSNFLQNTLKEKPFVLFYYYEFFSKENLNNFNKILIEEGLKAFKIKKNTLKTTSFKHLENIIKNNTLIIYPLNKEKVFEFKQITKTSNVKNLHFLGMFSNNKFFRVFELKKLNTLNPKNTQIELIHILKNTQKNLQKTLTLKKNSF